ncbi:hypothetical protein DER44DRAFT_816049 [Fusarium oxysporum]|nr:hypothetical protein DER44DRAFT_816049 [Fusarium oxysporum]
MASPVDPRKRTDYHESPNRQSLPSISEFIRDTKPGTYTHRPLSSVQTDSSLSLPLVSVHRPPPKAGKHPSLHQLLSTSSVFPQQHTLPAFSDPLLPSFTSPPSPLSVSDCCQSPSVKAEIPSQHRLPEQQKTQEPHPPFRQISSSSRTILDCAETYNRIACEQHGAHAIPERLPTEWELSKMLSNIELIKRSLEHIEDLVQTSIQNERTREVAKIKKKKHAPISIYAMQPSSSTTRTTKRLACASQTGRCHKCGRTQTPEWRRGPDGMRTLCNACGLHYAKVKRKRQLKTSSIYPEPEKALQLQGSELKNIFWLVKEGKLRGYQSVITIT